MFSRQNYTVASQSKYLTQMINSGSFLGMKSMM